MQAPLQDLPTTVNIWLLKKLSTSLLRTNLLLMPSRNGLLNRESALIVLRYLPINRFSHSPSFLWRLLDYMLYAVDTNSLGLSGFNLTQQPPKLKSYSSLSFTSGSTSLGPMIFRVKSTMSQLISRNISTMWLLALDSGRGILRLHELGILKNA